MGKIWQCLNWQYLLAVWLLVAVASCRGETTSSKVPSVSQVQKGESQTKKLKVVASFLPVYWFTSAVAGDQAKVELLVPPGTDVHEYQATPASVKTLADGDVLVKNGMGLEEFLTATVKNAQNPKLVEIEASKGISELKSNAVVKPVEGEGEKHEHEGAKGHNHEEGNPHVWLDPVLAKQQVETIRDGLIAADPKNKGVYEANASAYIQKLEQLDASFQQQLGKYQDCTFITFHDAFGYLASRYNLKQVAVVALPESSLSPADVQKTIAAVKQYQVKALFGEPGVDNKLLQSLAKDLNLSLRPLDSMESGPLDPQHYFTAMQANLQTIESACK